MEYGREAATRLCCGEKSASSACAGCLMYYSDDRGVAQIGVAQLHPRLYESAV